MTRALPQQDSRSDNDVLSRTLKILSYNIQVGVETQRYREYVTQGWKHVLPHPNRVQNLNRIAGMLAEYDMVSLQEVDAGSLRSGFIDITEYLAQRAGFRYWYHQVNRNIGVIARHSNGFLSQREPSQVTHHKLPAAPGRGATVLEFQGEHQLLTICSMHLALGRRARGRQLGFIREMVADAKNLIVMGDLNAGCDSDEISDFVQQLDLYEPAHDQPTFPSWRPHRKIDHILVSKSLKIKDSKVLDYPLSDHLPISVEIELPENF